MAEAANNAMMTIHFTHSVVKNFNLEKAFSGATTVQKLKERLEFACGTAPGNQILQIRNANEEVLNTLHPDDATIAACGVTHGCNIYIVDIEPDAQVKLAAGLVKMNMDEVKYEIDEEKYKNRPDSFHQFKQQHLQGFYKQKAEKALKVQKLSQEAAKKIEVGMRCETGTKRDPRRGVVKWKGRIGDSETIYVGVQLDEPVGKNDGSAKGVRYFECPDKFGLFVQAHKMEVGDFPEIDEFVSDDSDAEL